MVMSTQDAEVRRIGIVGAGTMGAGIATSCITHGLDVTLIDTQLTALESGERRIRATLDAAVKKGRLTSEAAAAAQARVAVATDLRALYSANVVIEAVFESLE